MKTIFAWLISLMFLGSGFAYAGTYLDSAHGDSVSGVDRSAVTGVTAHPDVTNEYVIGHCGHCHDMHASIGGVEPAPTGDTQNIYALFKENYGGVDRNQLCYACHNNLAVGTPGNGRYGIYQGYIKYEASSHDDSANFSWPDGNPPGPQSPDAGNCLNCHNPHGYDDGSLIPSQLFKREEDLCEACHDGSPALATKDIQAQINKASAHPTDDYSGRHSESEDMTPANFAYDAVTDKRHAECVDCHNPHVAKTGTHAIGTNAVSNVLLGVSGVSVTNSTAWIAPSYSTIDNETGITKEYELCFKCHSTWTTQPTGQTNIALQFNYKNASYHPVEADLTGDGSTALTDAQMGTDWKNEGLQTMYCSDCHGDDASLPPAGPHGSASPTILKGRWPKNSSGVLWTLGDAQQGYNNFSTDCLCTKCHPVYDTGWKNNAHSGNGNHNTTYTCVQCHVGLPHGSAHQRLIAYVADPPPYDYNDDSATLTQFIRAATPTGYGNSNSNCYSAVSPCSGSGGRH
ncbi:MAG TPA: cytochrome c3 family protein [Anaerolineae bacterium]|nr:cytochrome c3 family protein [Anaerolineae bacterium]